MSRRAAPCPVLPASRHGLALEHCKDALAFGRTLARNRVPEPDLIGACRLAAVEAAARFDAGRGVKFTVFLYPYVRHHVQKAIYGALAVHLPTCVSGDVKRLLADPDARADPSVLARAEAVRVAWRWPHSLYEADPETGRGYWEQAVAPVPGGGLDYDERERIAAALARLPARDREVVRRLYGLGGDPPLALSAAARAMGLTRQRAYQIHERAKRRLRSLLDPSSFFPAEAS